MSDGWIACKRIDLDRYALVIGFDERSLLDDPESCSYRLELWLRVTYSRMKVRVRRTKPRSGKVVVEIV